MSNILTIGDAAIVVDGKAIVCNSVGIDTSDATLTSGAQMLSPYTSYSNGYRYQGSITSKAAATYYPSTTDQTIASTQYLSGDQTIAAVTVSNITAGNIKKDVTVKVGDSDDDDRIVGVTGTYEGEIIRLITNDNNITPTGTYATSTYYNTSYGVKIGYMADGDIIVSMRAGTTTSYEYLYFNLVSAPSGVTITEVHNTSSSYATAAAGLIYACVISGLTVKAQMSIDMSTYNGTGDYTRVDITITANS